MSRRRSSSRIGSCCIVLLLGELLTAGALAQQGGTLTREAVAVDSPGADARVFMTQTPDSVTTVTPLRRPRIALALAGGGARGGAHIGVLKVLEELRIPVDCIAGTSMGALVGGGYASGLSATDIEQFVTGVDWKAVVGGVGSRQFEPVEQKRFNDASGSVEVGVKGGKVVPPSGLVNSSRIEDVLRSYVAKARSVTDFDKLPIPYRAVTTDMLTGNMVVLGSGDIAQAMRASMAIPGAFAPVITDQYVLQDGFVVRNLPIDVARSLCGDIVIAVNLAKPTAKREQLVGPASYISRSNDIMSEANERVQLQTLTERDIRIDVDLGDFSAADFERTAETIPLGEKAARAMAPRLAALSMSRDEYAAWRRQVTTSQQLKIQVADVQFRGLKYVSPDYLRSLSRVKAGDTVDVASISADAARFAVLDDLESVGYHLEGNPDHPVLVWEPHEKQIGPDVLRPNMGIYAGAGGELRFELGVEYVRRWLNNYGAQWRNRLQVGTTSLLETSFYQPLSSTQTFFVEPGALIGRSIEDLYNNYERVAQYYFVDFGGRLDVGVNLGTDGQFRAGYWADRRRVDVSTGVAAFPTGQATDAGLVMTGLFDSRDSSPVATRGTAAEIQYFHSDRNLGAERSWETLETAVRQVIHAGKMVMWLTAAGGTDLGTTLPADRAFSLGGPQSFAGYASGEVRVRKYWTAKGATLWRIADILPIANQALYGGVGVGALGAYDRVDPVPDGTLYGMAGFIGGNTPFGTLTLGIGKATGSWAGWVTLGAPVGSGSILDNPMFR